MKELVAAGWGYHLTRQPLDLTIGEILEEGSTAEQTVRAAAINVAGKSLQYFESARAASRASPRDWLRPIA